MSKAEDWIRQQPNIAKDQSIIYIGKHSFVEEDDFQALAEMLENYAAPAPTQPEASGEVFSRPECPFMYCDTEAPHNECRERCRHTGASGEERK